MSTNESIEALGPARIAWSESYRLPSKAIGQDFLIEVALPPGGIEPGKELPVVFVLDGNQTFGSAVGAARFIQSGPFPLPRTLVVGIGYHFDTPQERIRAGILRVRDLTPCSDPLLEAQYPDSGMTPGGADAFLGFIETELQPFLAARYPVDGRDQTLVGSSLAGLLALYALFTSPGRFQRYVAISPAIYWADGLLFELEKRLAASGDDLSARLFLAAGELEEGHDPKQAFVSNVHRLEAALRSRNHENLDLVSRIFEGETHMSVYPGAVTFGLGAVFGGYRDMDDWSRWMNASKQG